MNATMDRCYYGFRTSADRTVGSENEKRLDMIRSATVDGEDSTCVRRVADCVNL
jgi:hypothetical protein